MNYIAAAVWAVASLGLPLARESSSSQSPQDPAWSTQPRTPFPTWGFQRSPSPGGGVAVVEEEPSAGQHALLLAVEEPGAHTGQKGLSVLLAPLGLWGLWPQVRSAILPWGWPGGGEARQSAGLRPGPSMAAALAMSVFRAAGSVHLSSHHQASSEDLENFCPASRRRGETECQRLCAGSSRHDLGGMGDWGH